MSYAKLKYKGTLILKASSSIKVRYNNNLPVNLRQLAVCRRQCRKVPGENERSPTQRFTVPVSAYTELYPPSSTDLDRLQPGNAVRHGRRRRTAAMVRHVFRGTYRRRRRSAVGRTRPARRRLDAVRSLTAVRAHCNNAFGRDIGVFSATELHFSVGGKVFDGRRSQPVVYVAGRDDFVEQSHYVTGAARFVRLLMHFDRRWIMISEVHFDTEPVSESYDEAEENEGSPATIATASVFKTGTATLPLRQCRLELVTETQQWARLIFLMYETGRSRGDTSRSVWWASDSPSRRSSATPTRCSSSTRQTL